jgi:hypothetical protein
MDAAHQGLVGLDRFLKEGKRIEILVGQSELSPLANPLVGMGEEFEELAWFQRRQIICEEVFNLLDGR